MKVRSTGLGKTVMVANFKELLNAEYDGRKVVQLTLEATEPLHWTIRAFMEPKDIRNVVAMVTPSIIWRGLLALLIGRFHIFQKAEPGAGESSRESALLSAVPPEPSHASPLAKLKG
jgi:hypothetical protein